tara:strand:+ start:39 stop:257 length:219 start_codon:yes stop_codon:yes gene_type:complete
MVNFVKVKIKKSVNLKDEHNIVLVNLDNIVKIERISDRIIFSSINSTMQSIIGVYNTPKEAEEEFNKIFNDY